MWKASHNCNRKQVCMFFKRYFMVSVRKLHAIFRPSLKGHSFVCVTLIGLKFPDIYSHDSSVHYKSFLSWLAHWDDFWLKKWRDTGRQKLIWCLKKKKEYYTLLCYFHVVLSFNDTVAMCLHDVRCKFLPGNRLAFARKEL